MPDTNIGTLLTTPVDRPADGQVARPASRVDEIKRGQLDGRGFEIERIYALRSKEYAVYWADGIGVQFADDPELEKEQRKRVLAIGEARADLASLLMGWKPERRKVYDYKIALALQLALDDETVAAQKTIDSARADVLNERAAAGRLQYLASAAASCVVLGLLLWAIRALAPKSLEDFWFAGQAGLAGAAFSIVLAIKSRTVALDTDLTGNASDGLLRLAIGMISGGFLLLLLESGALPKIVFGAADLSAASLTLQLIVVLGFIAGFMERMVPDLLDKAQSQPTGAPAQPPA